MTESKRPKRFLKALLAVGLSLIVILAGCGGSNGGAGGTGGGGDAPQAGGGSSDSPGGTAEPPYEIVIAWFYFGAEQRDTDLIAEEVSKITREKINATVKFMPLSIGAYTQQMNLVLSGNEKLDLLVVMSDNRAAFINRGQLLELDDLLDRHGQAIKEAVGDFLEAARVGGKTYVVPTIRDFAASYGFNMRKDLVEKHGIDVSSIKTFEDVGNVLRLIKQAEPDVYPLVGMLPNTGIFGFGHFMDDPLGDELGVLPGYDNEFQVVNRFEQDYYAEHLNLLHQWYKEGLIQPDIATYQGSRNELFYANKAFGWFNHLKPGYEIQASLEMGTDIVTVELTEPVATTATVLTINWGIPRNSQNPEKAMQMLNLMYSDPDIMNLLAWGIEGKHYVFNDDGTIRFPDGVDPDGHGYNYQLSWMWGNQFLTHVWQGNPPDIWEQTKAFNERAIKSAALGFNFDTTTVQTEFAAVTNVLEQFRVGLETGTLDPAKTLPDFINRLKAAGIEKIIQEKQRQLDEWRAANGK